MVYTEVWFSSRLMSLNWQMWQRLYLEVTDQGCITKGLMSWHWHLEWCSWLVWCIGFLNRLWAHVFRKRIIWGLLLAKSSSNSVFIPHCLLLQQPFVPLSFQVPAHYVLLEDKGPLLNQAMFVTVHYIYPLSFGYTLLLLQSMEVPDDENVSIGPY